MSKYNNMTDNIVYPILKNVENVIKSAKNYSGASDTGVNFKKKFTLSQRTLESARILSKYPDRVPIIVEKVITSDLPDIDKNKYLVPKDLTAIQFIYVIRKRISLTPEKAMFLFVGDKNTLLTSSDLMSNVYEDYMNQDGFLYFQYSGENSFGHCL
jgi:GABA(A) receptor-associated protein